MIPRTLFSEGHELFRESVRRFIAAEIVPHHAEWEKAGQVPRELWLKAGQTGLLCCNVPEEFGGSGSSFSAANGSPDSIWFRIRVTSCIEYGSEGIRCCLHYTFPEVNYFSTNQKIPSSG